MRYLSTRGKSKPVGFSEALEASLAPDGGLFVPERYPRVVPEAGEAARLASSPAPLAELAARCLGPFLEGDPLAAELSAIAREALTFATPLRAIGPETAILELFHGPTAAFKDVGARFLAECLARLPSREKRLVLVATSGDTGGAVAAAFHGKPGIDVAILFPKGRISPRQEKQLTCWGGNVRAFAVRGAFDDCQRLVKTALADPALRARRKLVSANSISIGRLVPQQLYYALASLSYREQTGRTPGIIVPTGNLGNAVACLWAKRAGFPIGRVVCATNANRAIPEYLRTGEWRTSPTIATLANAMDVGNPSNIERVFHLYPDKASLEKDVAAVSVSDDEIRETIREGERTWGEIFCPHTATAFRARTGLPGDWIVVATAHPAKFDTIVEPLVGHPVPVPPQLAALLDRPSHATEIGTDSAALAAVLAS